MQLSFCTECQFSDGPFFTKCLFLSNMRHSLLGTVPSHTYVAAARGAPQPFQPRSAPAATLGGSRSRATAWRAAILAAGGRRWNGGPTMHCAVRMHCAPGRDGVPSPSACTAAYCNPAEQRTRKPGKIGDVLVARRISMVCCGSKHNRPICQYRHRSR